MSKNCMHCDKPKNKHYGKEFKCSVSNLDLAVYLSPYKPQLRKMEKA